MLKMKNWIKGLRKQEAGNSLVEYSLIAALVSVVCIGAMTAVGTGVNNVLTSVSTKLNTP